MDKCEWIRVDERIKIYKLYLKIFMKMEFNKDH